MGTDKTRSFGTPNGGPEDAASSRGAAPLAAVQPGLVLVGKYWVERVLAQGGMGTVVLARHLQLDEHVAIKFLRDEIVSDADAATRFAREARTAIKIKSEHVARVIDVGSLENGAPFMVMEYLHGEDLAAWIQARGPLPLEQAVEFVLQACEAISEAHGLGIVHRDLKPPNLFVTRRADGIFAVKVLDFGISKVTVAGADGTGTTKSMVVGSPSYMSPEQLASPADVDARSDIWSLGVTLFEMLTGRVPFEADTVPLICGKILRDPPPLVRELRADVPEKVEAIIGKCLEKERAKRYSTVGDLAMALAPFGPERARASAARVWRTVEAAGLPSSSMAEPGTDGSSEIDASPHPTRVVWNRSSAGAPEEHPKGWDFAASSARGAAPKRRRTTVLGAALLLASIGLGAFLTRSHGSPSEGPSRAPADRQPRSATAPVGESSSRAAESAVAPPDPPPAPSMQPSPADSRSAEREAGHAPAKVPVVNRGPRSGAPNVRASSSSSPRTRPSSVFDTRD